MKEHQKLVKSAQTHIRSLLHLLRLAGVGKTTQEDATPNSLRLPLDSEMTWSANLKQIHQKLKDNYRTPKIGWFDFLLKPAQIRALFGADQVEGLVLETVLAGNITKPRVDGKTWILRKTQFIRHPRILSVFIVSNGSEMDIWKKSLWRSRWLEEFSEKHREQQFFRLTSSVSNTQGNFGRWVQFLHRNPDQGIGSLHDIVQELRALQFLVTTTGWQERGSENFLGVPLLGRMVLRITKAPNIPSKARVVVVYAYHEAQ